MNEKDYVVMWLLFLSAVWTVLGSIVLGLHITDSVPGLSYPGLIFIGVGVSGFWTARKINKKKSKKS